MSLLGQPVGAFMSSPVQVIGSPASLAELQARMLDQRLSSLAVIDDDRLVGIVSYTDLLRVARDEEASDPYENTLVLPDDSVASIMSPDVISTDVSTPLSRAAAVMAERGLHRIFVQSGPEVVGVVSTRELMVAVRDAGSADPVSELMSKPVITAKRSAALADVDEILSAHRITGVVIVSTEGRPIGMYSQREALVSAHIDRRRVVESVMSTAVMALPSTTPIHSAAARAAEKGVRRICAVDGDALVGLISGLDFARYVARAH